MVPGQNLESRALASRVVVIALLVVLGFLVPNLGLGYVVVAIAFVAVHGVTTYLLFARATRVDAITRARWVGLVGDLLALAIAMWVWSPDPSWIVLGLTPIGLISGAFRFGLSGAYVAAALLSLAQIAIIPARPGTLQTEIQEAALRLAMYWIVAFTLGRLIGRLAEEVADREAMVTRAARTGAADPR